MLCRKDIKVRKIWVDDNNAYNTRPGSVVIHLLRDGEIYDTAELTAEGGWVHTFKCLLIWNNSKEYVYKVDEPQVPENYTKSISGYNITNTLNKMTVHGAKTWDDNHNAGGIRPPLITIFFLQNGTLYRTINVSTPSGEDRVPFSFDDVPFADDQGTPYTYTVDEGPMLGYKKAIDGCNITNTLITGDLTFTKKSTATGLELQGAVFELRQNGSLIATSMSDIKGTVSFPKLMPGSYLMAETASPAGYMADTTVYNIVVFDDGTITVDGIPVTEFSVNNTPQILIRRATSVTPAYMAAPNTWPLHGTGTSDLYMTDKLVIITAVTPVKVKWDYGVKDVSYFSAGGGYDVTASYTNGIPAYSNGEYTVYLKFSSGYEVALTITIDNIRDGSIEMPYLLIDYTTANALEPSVTGIGQYILDFMQGADIKLTKNYELYEKVDMTGKPWAPLGDATSLGFTGTFYGNGNDIEHMSMTVTTGSTYNTGMFARVSNGAVIENLGLTDCTIVNTRWNAAGFAGHVATTDGSTTILRDLRFSGSASASSTGGGIVSAITAIDGNVLIDGCSTNGIITGVSGGGIAGFASIQTAGKVTISNCNTTGSCYSTGTSNLNYAGGILGACSDVGNGLLIIEKCVSAMSIHSNAKAGGILGAGNSVNASSISACVNLGQVTGVNYAGGITADFTASNSINMMVIENCYNTGKITAAAATTGYAGGIIGICHSYITVKNSYNAGDVIASAGGTQNIVGGISGNYGLINNCAAINALCSSRQSSIARISQSTASASQSLLDNNAAFENMQVLINGVQKSPLDTGSSGTDGLSASAAVIKTQSLYETTLGWDFGSVWTFGNQGYILPVLRDIPLGLQPSVLPSHL